MNTGKPYFSIITPTYNRADYLPDAIKCVQAQNFSNYEHIIVDDGSTDDTKRLVSEYAKADSRIIYIGQENKGRSTARNVGIEASKSRFICFLDSDDFWKPRHLEALHQETSKLSSAALLHTGLIWFNQSNNSKRPVPFDDPKSYNSNIEYALKHQFATIAVCVSRSILNVHQFNPNRSVNEDIELWCKILMEYPLVVINEHTTLVRIHDGNTKNMPDQIALYQEQIDAFKSILREMPNKKFVAPKFRKTYLASLEHRKWKAINNQQSIVHLFWATFVFCLKHPAHNTVFSKILFTIRSAVKGRSELSC